MIMLALNSARCVLKDVAIPSVFPWTNESFHRINKTSQMVASDIYQRIEEKVPVSSGQYPS